MIAVALTDYEGPAGILPVKKWKKGDEFPVYGVYESPCKCGGIGLDIGYRSVSNAKIMHCFTCGAEAQTNGRALVDSIRFKPKEDFSDLKTIEEVLQDIQTEKKPVGGGER